MKRRRAEPGDEAPPDATAIYDGCTTQWQRWEAMEQYTKQLNNWARDIPEREAIKHELWRKVEQPGPLPDGWI